LKKSERRNRFVDGNGSCQRSSRKIALEYDIDVLWVGARTTVNPFAMQELADALQGTKKIVLVKILLTDLSLWLAE
jgi:chorismate mutase